MMKCLDPQNLEDYLTGSLPDIDRQNFEAHLQLCDTCRQLLDRERLVDEILRPHLALKAPGGLVERVMTALQEKPVGQPVPDWLWGFGLGAFLLGLTVVLLIHTPPWLASGFDLSTWRSLLDKLIENSQLVSTCDWLKQWTHGSLMMIMNLIVGGVILCWGLWQMVMALRK